MNAPVHTDSDSDLFREDLVVLKRDVASLIGHTKGRATNTVQDAPGQVRRRVWRLGHKRQREAIAPPRRSISSSTTSPVAARSLALAVGYVGPRALRG
jgi:hypothetical protein